MPTIKQQKAAEALVGNGGNITQAMITAGYSPNTANTPQKLTESDGFRELMEEYLPDDLLLEKHLELLNKTEKIAKNNNATKQVEVIDTGEPDTQAVSKALDMAYKMKGSYAPEKRITLDLTQESSLTGETIAEIKARVKAKQTGNDNGNTGQS